MQLETPISLQLDHEVLLSKLNEIASTESNVALNAKNVADVFRAHFRREEKTVLPQLSLLMTIVEGQWSIDTKEALLKNNILIKEFQELKGEHQKIHKAAEEMVKVSLKENNKEAKKIAEEIILHIQIEEEVSYPAILLINKYLNNLNGYK